MLTGPGVHPAQHMQCNLSAVVIDADRAKHAHYTTQTYNVTDANRAKGALYTVHTYNAKLL